MPKTSKAKRPKRLWVLSINDPEYQEGLWEHPKTISDGTYTLERYLSASPPSIPIRPEAWYWEVGTGITYLAVLSVHAPHSKRFRG